MSRLTCLVVLLVLPSPAQAQWYTPMRADDRIELRARGAQRPVQGQFLRATEDSVWVRQDHSAYALSLPVAPLESVRIFRGTRREISRSALRGLLVGAAIGAGLGFVAGLTDEGFSEFFGGPIGGAAITGGLLAAPGAVIGGLLGISVPVWEGVPLPER